MNDSQQERWVMVGAVLIALAVVGTVVWGFGQQFYRLYELRAVEAELTPLVAYEKERNEILHQELKHVLSPEYTEEWARVHGGMTLEGETRLSMPPSTETTSLLTASSTQEPAPTFWEKLRQQLFGGD